MPNGALFPLRPIRAPGATPEGTGTGGRQSRKCSFWDKFVAFRAGYSRKFACSLAILGGRRRNKACHTGSVSSLEAFGPNLRRRRMRSGLSLEDLSTRTKVSVELWDAMERNDFSRWPTGVAARSYIRSYAEAVGVDPEATVDEFCRLVPNGDRRAERLVRGTAEFLGHQLVWSDDLPPALPEGDRRAPAVRPETASGLPWWLEAYPRHIAAGIESRGRRRARGPRRRPCQNRILADAGCHRARVPRSQRGAAWLHADSLGARHLPVHAAPERGSAP